MVCTGAARLPEALAEAVRANRAQLLSHAAGGGGAAPESTGAATSESHPSNAVTSGALAAEPAAVDAVLVVGCLYSLPAADLYRRSVPFSAAREGECRCCGGTRFWRLKAQAPWICARCHPNEVAMVLPTTEVRDA